MALQRSPEAQDHLSSPEVNALSRLVIADSGERLPHQAYRPNQIIIREGDVGDELHIITRGGYRAFREGRILGGTDGMGAFFGEIGAINDVKRTATVIAWGYTETIVLRTQDVAGLLTLPEPYPSIHDILTNTGIQRLQSIEDPELARLGMPSRKLWLRHEIAGQRVILIPPPKTVRPTRFRERWPFSQ